MKQYLTITIAILALVLSIIFAIQLIRKSGLVPGRVFEDDSYKIILGKENLDLENGKASRTINRIKDLQTPENIEFRLRSPDFENESTIPEIFTCKGQDISPSFIIEEVPDNAESMVLIVEDPDAPTKTWVHWILYNIPANTSIIPENTIPDNANLGWNDFGSTNYDGPCPPSGTHRYIFTLYAIDKQLDPMDGLSRDQISKEIDNHIISKTELIRLYTKQ